MELDTERVLDVSAATANQVSGGYAYRCARKPWTQMPFPCVCAQEVVLVYKTAKFDGDMGEYCVNLFRFQVLTNHQAEFNQLMLRCSEKPDTVFHVLGRHTRMI